jgi:hypothetical protein
MLELVTGMPAVSQDLSPPQLCLRVKDFMKVDYRCTLRQSFTEIRSYDKLFLRTGHYGCFPTNRNRLK